VCHAPHGVSTIRAEAQSTLTTNPILVASPRWWPQLTFQHHRTPTRTSSVLTPETGRVRQGRRRLAVSSRVSSGGRTLIVTAVEARVLDRADDAHAAVADFGEDFVRAELRTGIKRHGSIQRSQRGPGGCRELCRLHPCRPQATVAPFSLGSHSTARQASDTRPFASPVPQSPGTGVPASETDPPP